MFLMMSKSDSPSSIFLDKTFFTISLKDFSSSFVPDVVGAAWLSFIFLELERRPIFGIDFNLTECF